MFDDDEPAELEQQLKQEAKAAEKASRGKKPKAAAAKVVKLCYICTNEAMNSKRWCQVHNQAYDCMCYQAKKNGEVEILEAAMASA